MKCRTIKFRCSESEKERIEGMSREAGTTISEYCRQQSLTGRILANRKLSPDGYIKCYAYEQPLDKPQPIKVPSHKISNNDLYHFGWNLSKACVVV